MTYKAVRIAERVQRNKIYFLTQVFPICSLECKFSITEYRQICSFYLSLFSQINIFLLSVF